MQAADVGLLILRLVVGLTFSAHGAQKAFGWWNGPGSTKWRAAIERMGFRPVLFWAAVSTAAELVGGLLLALGLFTAVAAAALIGQSIVIIGKVHLPNGFWSKANGFEYPLSLAAGAVAIDTVGPGRLSLDTALGLTPQPTVVAGLLMVGILGGLLAVANSLLAAPASQQRR